MLVEGKMVVLSSQPERVQPLSRGSLALRGVMRKAQLTSVLSVAFFIWSAQPLAAPAVDLLAQATWMSWAWAFRMSIMPGR
jgi:hypothetical protein